MSSHAADLQNALDEQIDAEVIPYLWQKGDLTWKLDNTQTKIYRFLRRPGRKKSLEVHRKGGKTKTALVYALEECLRNPGAIWNIYCQTKTTARKIVIPLMAYLTSDCPEEIKPQYHTIDSYYEFPGTGARLYLIGCDDIRDIENNRGPRSDGNIFDEAAYNNYLQYLFESVVAPQQLTSPNAINLFLSTTAKIPDHYFFTISAICDATGDYLRIPIDQNEDLTDEQKESAFNEIKGGRDSVNCQREYFCRRVADPETMILYAFDEAKHVGIIPRDDNYKHWHKYVSCDWGTADSTFGVFGVYIRDRQLLYIEDEFEVSGVQANTSIVSGLLYQKRAELGHEFGWDKPYRQVGDNDLRAIGDLNQIYGHQFTGITKDRSHEQGFKEACVDSANYQLQSNRILIHPRCERLIKQCRNGLWKKKPVEFARIEGFGHFDGIDALIYLNRMVDRTSNPVPIQQSHDPLMRHIIKDQAGYYEKQEQMNKIFGRNFGEKENDTSFL